MDRGSLKLAVLDMAGTTVAMADVVAAAMEGAFERFGLRLPADAVAGIRGRSKKEAVRELVAGLDAAARPAGLGDQVYDAFRQLLGAHCARGVAPVPGAVETMQWLRSRGVKVVLTTGFDRELADLILATLGWGPALVDAVVCADEVARGRPAPDLIFRAMALTGVSEADAVAVVGDTSADLLAAASAKAGWIVGVLSGAHPREELVGHPHSVLLKSIADLPRWWLGSLPGGPQVDSSYEAC